MTYYIKSGNTYRIAPADALNIQESLPAGNYILQADQNGLLFLQTIDKFEPPPKLYGDIPRNADRILNTFLDRKGSTGILLAGEKGSGKSLLAKTVVARAKEIDIPTIVINQPYFGDYFCKFMQDISQGCIVLFDEFEKIYDDKQQQQLLSLFDGVFPSKKMFIVTCNDSWRLSEHMRNRPGRFFYAIDFTSVGAEFIKEYCEDKLHNKDHIEKICNVATLYDKFNFDMLQALVEESNRYNEDPMIAIRLLNAKPHYGTHANFDMEVVVDGVKLESSYLPSKTLAVNPFKHFSFNYKVFEKGSDTDWDWEDVNISPADLIKVRDSVFHFHKKDQNIVLTLTKQPERKIDYFAF